MVNEKMKISENFAEHAGVVGIFFFPDYCPLRYIMQRVDLNSCAGVWSGYYAI